MTHVFVVDVKLISYSVAMANSNNIETSVSADIKFGPSVGESLDDYLSCLSSALHDLMRSDDIRSAVEGGHTVTISIDGMPQASGDAEDSDGFSLNEFINDRVTCFSRENPETMGKIGEEVLKHTVQQFFERLTGEHIIERPNSRPRAKACSHKCKCDDAPQSGMSPLAQRLLKEVGLLG